MSNDVQLLDLLIDSSLSLSQSGIDLLQLILDLLNLVLSILDHLIGVLDLSLEVIGKLSLLSLLKVLLQKLLTVLQQLGLLLTNRLHRGQKRFNLLEILGRGFSLTGNISNEDLKLASPLAMVVLQLSLPLSSLALMEEEIVGKLLNGIIILLTLDVFIVVLKLIELAKFLLNLIFLSLKL